VAKKMGLDPTRNLHPNVADALAGYIDTRVREAWEDYAWPELCPTEARVYRPAWDATVEYAYGQEVWDPESRAYYMSLSDGNRGNAINALDEGEGLFVEIPGPETFAASGFWQQTGTLNRTVLLDQPGFTPIGDVMECWASDPETTARPIPLDYRITGSGVEFGPHAPDRVWIQFRLRNPEFTATPWSAGKHYAPGELLYFATDGDCYRAKVHTVAGESPDTTPTKWDKQPLPSILVPFVELAAYADALEEEGQTDKAAIVNSKATNRLTSTEDRINVQQRQTAHFSVRSR
jgi:hypothetical protein